MNYKQLGEGGPQYSYAQSPCPEGLDRYPSEHGAHRRGYSNGASHYYGGYDDRYGAISPDGYDRRRRFTVWKVALPVTFILCCLYVVLYDYVDIRHDSIAGWSSDTSRDTRTYVLPDNVTLLNQPKSICDLDDSSNVKANSKKDTSKEGDSEIFLLVIICSKMENFQARAAIRDTWGNQLNYEKLSKTFQNISRHFQTVNVTEKLLSDFGDFSNYTSMDRRYRRDLSEHLSDIENVLFNYTSVENDGKSVIPTIYSPENENSTHNFSEPSNTHHKIGKRDLNNPNFINEDELRNNIYLKNNFKDDNELPDDPRFDNGVIKPSTFPPESEDDNILGNFEEAATDNKNLDYYDYASEPSNIMRIPPRGEKVEVDEEVLKSVAEAQNIVKLTLDNDRLKLQYQESDDKIKNDAELPIRIRFLFLLGQSSNENNTELQSKIDDEASIYDDIIQEGFVDSYNNLTLKSMMLLKWVVSNCAKNVHYIMKTDDDMYINIPRLVDALKNKTKEFIMKAEHIKANNPKDIELQLKNIPQSKKKALLKSEKLLMGDLICEARPISDTSSKWYSPKYMYPGAVYPHYLSGTGYVMSFATAKALYNAALSTPLFHLEDIFITGMCSKNAGIKPVDHEGFSYSIRKFDACTFAYLITAHQMSPSQIHRMHSMLAKSPPKLLEMCEVKRILSNRTSSLMKTVITKLGGQILGSPRSFINGLKGLGQSNSKSATKRKRLNNGCF